MMGSASASLDALVAVGVGELGRDHGPRACSWEARRAFEPTSAPNAHRWPRRLMSSLDIPRLLVPLETRSAGSPSDRPAQRQPPRLPGRQ